MKTPHEWVEILTAPDRDFAELDMEDSIKAIQDEAFKAGLLKAIELCHANEMSHLYIWQRIQREHDKLP